MYPPPFTYVRAESLEHALELLTQHGDEARPLAGGQSLLPFMKLLQMGPSVLVDIGRLQGLDGVREANGGATIGALTRHAHFARRANLKTLPVSGLPEAGGPSALTPLPTHLALLGDAARVIADVQVRNRGTVGGSLAYADPAGDWAPALLALDASVRLRDARDERSIPLAEFFLGEYETAMGPGEILTQIEAPGAAPGSTGAYLKLARRHGDYAVASVAVQVSWGDDGSVERAGIGLGGLGDTPIKATAAEDLLRGRMLDAGVIDEARELVVQATEPHSDHRGTAEYRRAMAGVLFARALDAAALRRRGEPATTGYL